MENSDSVLRSTAVLSVLQAYYPVVYSLRTYLETILDDQGSCIRASHPSNCDGYERLLESSYVAGPLTLGGSFTPMAPMAHMHDVIDHAQERLFLRCKGSRPSNIITAGYRKVTHQDASNVGGRRVPLANYFVNTMITALQAPEWELLLERVGEDAMFHLLTETTVFVSLPNGCLCQMTGEPVVNIRPPATGILSIIPPGGDKDKERLRGDKRQAPDTLAEERPSKRLRISHGRGNTTVWSTDQERVKPVEVAFVRARMFYSQPSFIAHTTTIMVGLPLKHILNRIYPSWQPRDRTIQLDPDLRERMEHARHLARYIFPRQYGLQHPFTSTSGYKYGACRLPDYMDRELEIKNKGPCKTPKRLKHVLDILEILTWKHHRCRYKMLLDLACPTKLPSDNGSSLDSSAILEIMSESSIQLQSQATAHDTSISLDSAGRPIISHDTSQIRRQAKTKPRFAEFACGFGEVLRFAALVTKAVIPEALWGCKKNFELIMHHVKHMITARRFETLTVHHVLQRFQTSECEWLAPQNQAAQKQTRVSVMDQEKRRELLEDFLFWYFDSFLVPLLKTTFYITESAAFRNKVLYFRHDDWRTLCAPLIEKLSTNTFEKIDEHETQEILRQRRLGFSFVRLLPKETGVRPIVNLRKRREKHSQSINQILQAAFQILTYEKDCQSHKLGGSVFGRNQIYAKLKAFKSRLTEGKPSTKLPKLYFVKVDVQACFDTIEQTKLLSILRDLISEDVYMIQKYGTVNKAGDRIMRKYVKKAIPEDDHPHFLAYAAGLAGMLRNTIFVDQVVYQYSRKEEILALLEEHITENIVKMGSEYYRQVIGIPQGSVLSTILCSFFYGDLERRMYSFTEDPGCCLMRLIDDWLFITTKQPQARKFYDMVSTGHPEYGCFISKDKSLVNFDHPDLVNIVDPRSKVFPWCGFAINMTDLSVTTDYSRFNSTYLQDSLTVEYSRRPGAAFKHKMVQLARAKSHIIYHDPELNVPHAIFLNIYQSFTVLAMKMHHYLRLWGLDVSRNHTLVSKTIRECIRLACPTTRSNTDRKLPRESKTGGAGVIAHTAQVTWLGTHAFHTVLSRKPQAYTHILKKLRFELELPKHRYFKKRHQRVIAEGLSTLTLLCF